MRDLLCILDTETTGLDAQINEVIQVAALFCTTSFKVVGSISFKLHPENPKTITKKAVEINGYSPRTWKAKFRSHRKAWLYFNKEYRRITRGYNVILVGQNVTFDYKFLKAEYKRAGVKIPFNRNTLDVIDVAKAWCKEAGITMASYNLARLCKLTGVKNKKAHDALGDVEATMAVLRWFVDDLNRRGKDVGTKQIHTAN